MVSLKEQWNNHTDFMVIDPTDGMHFSVLENAYNKIFEPNFPVNAGYHSLAMLTSLLQDQNGQVDTKFIAAGTNLRDNNRIVKGLAVSFYYKDSDTAQLVYLAVDPTFRSERLGHSLFKQYETVVLDSAQDNKGILKGHYISCQDPLKPLKPLHTYDTYDPHKRFNKYVEWGGQRVPFDFLVGYIMDGLLRMDDDFTLMALKHPLTNDYPSTQTTADFLESLWISGGVHNPKGDANFLRMLNNNQSTNSSSEKRANPPTLDH